MRGTFEGCGGLAVPLAGSAGELDCSFRLAFGGLIEGELPGDELPEDELPEDGTAAGVVIAVVAAEVPDCFAAATGFVIFCSACTITLPSCAFFSFHHRPPANSAQMTTNTNTSTIPGW